MQPTKSSPPRRRAPRGSAAVAVLLTVVAVVGTSIAVVPRGPAAAAAGVRASVTTATTPTTYPVGVFDLAEPSYMAPPSATALAGYTRSFVADFTTPLSPKLWGLFKGVPKGDASGLFVPSHVHVSDGLLRIGTWRDRAAGGRWASGGVCLCGIHTLYGAYFVRSRVTGTGPDDVTLLWPADNQWPPEIDFDETGTSPRASSWTVHFTAPADQVQHTVHLNVRHWHTWGVIWTPTSVTFIVDGTTWGEVTASAEVPTIPMTLDIQQQSWCGLAPECPTRSTSTLVDWVALYVPS